MKKSVLILIIVLISCEQKDYFPDKVTIWSGTTFIPVPDNYRFILGYDSIQLMVNNNGNISANFCYLNGLIIKDSLIAIKKNDTVFVRYPTHFPVDDDTITLKIISE